MHYLNIGMLAHCIVMLCIHYFMGFTITYEKHCKVTETLVVITVDFSLMSIYLLGTHLKVFF